MAFELIPNGSVTTPSGFQACGIQAGLKRSGALDMALIYSPRPCTSAGAFTSNLFAAAPVMVDRRIIASGTPVHAVIINSGNANACTGEQGLKDAEAVAARTATRLQLAPEQVLVSSTGRIGVPMPMDIILNGVDKAVDALSADGGPDAARAIMTTDTVCKHIAAQLDIDGVTVRLGGMTKGAGMICPRLRMEPPQATMLCYLTTDAVIDADALRCCLDFCLDRSYNRITVDGDTSTNDTVILLANGAAGNAPIRKGSPQCQAIAEALCGICSHLAKEMVKDGEGVSRFVEVKVTGAATDQDARICAESVAKSPLCKTAWFGADPNWGRILCAAGYSGIAFDPANVSLDMMGIPVVRNGLDAGVMSEEELAKKVAVPEVFIHLDLGAGQGSFTEWTCDFTYDYVKINADYHT